MKFLSDKYECVPIVKNKLHVDEVITCPFIEDNESSNQSINGDLAMYKKALVFSQIVKKDKLFTLALSFPTEEKAKEILTKLKEFNKDKDVIYSCFNTSTFHNDRTM